MEVAGWALSQDGLGSVEANFVALRLVIWNELELVVLLLSSSLVEAKSCREESSCASLVRSSSRRDEDDEDVVCVTVTVDLDLMKDVLRRNDGGIFFCGMMCRIIINDFLPFLFLCLCTMDVD